MGKVVVEKTTGSAGGVLELEDIKRHLSLSIDDPTFDELLLAMEKAAADVAEKHTNRRLTPYTYKLYLDEWPSGKKYDRIELPFSPVTSVPSSGVVYTDSEGDSTTFSSTKWSLDSVSEPGAVVLDYNDEWPTVILHNSNPIAVEFDCGYSTGGDVPESIKLGMKMMIGHWFENREDTIPTAMGLSNVPLGARALLDSQRVYHIP